jgi:phage shock protein A
MTETDYGSEWRSLAVNLIGQLLTKVEELDKRCEMQLMQLSDLKKQHHELALKVGHLEYEIDRDEDNPPQQHCLEAMDEVSKATQVSLVERVRNRIASEYDPADYCYDEARAAIREVAAWFREQRIVVPASALEEVAHDD